MAAVSLDCEFEEHNADVENRQKTLNNALFNANNDIQTKGEATLEQRVNKLHSQFSTKRYHQICKKVAFMYANPPYQNPEAANELLNQIIAEQFAAVQAFVFSELQVIHKQKQEDAEESCAQERALIQAALEALEQEQSKKKKPASKKRAHEDEEEQEVVTADPLEGVLYIFCDGSCLKASSSEEVRQAGYALVFHPEAQRNFKRPLPTAFRPSSQIAEVLALTEAVKIALKEDQTKYKRVIIRSDSEYACNAWNKWMDAWVKRGWIKADGEPVAYRPQMEELLRMKAEISEQKRDVQVQHIFGHNKDPVFFNRKYNNAVDTMAKEASKTYVPNSFIR
jgi:ribonuclease HI